MSMNEPCPLCKKMIPIADVINNSCPHCGSKPPEIKTQAEREREAIAREDAVLTKEITTEESPAVKTTEWGKRPPDSDNGNETQKVPEVIPEGEMVVQLKRKVTVLENMVNGASVERLRLTGELKSLRQVVDTLGERMDQLESSVMDDWAERVAEQGYQSEKEMFDDMYNVKKMSMRTMAEVLKTSKFTVQKRMDKQGLKRRKVGQKVK